jgi:hypothetical protein
MLTHEDGLLATAIAREERISYRESVRKIEEYAGNCMKLLHAGTPVIIEGIGSFSFNPEGSLSFQPLPDVNLSAANFGLDSIFVHPAVPETVQHSRTVVRVDRKPKELRKKSPAPVKWTVALSLPIILFLLYGIIFPYSFQHILTNYTGIGTDLLIESQMNIPVKAEKSEPVMTISDEPEKPAAPVFQTVETGFAATEQRLDSNIPVTVGPKYYIIGGCFASESNAYKFRDLLKSRGFDAEVAGTTNNGHLRISYKSFPVRQDALVYLDEIRQKENPSAWLLKY